MKAKQAVYYNVLFKQLSVEFIHVWATSKISHSTIVYIS